MVILSSGLVVPAGVVAKFILPALEVELPSPSAWKYISAFVSKMAADPVKDRPLKPAICAWTVSNEKMEP